MKTKTKGLIALIVVIVAAIYYYVTIPAINIHSTDTWGAVLFLIVIALIVKLFFYGFRNPAKIRISDLKESKILRYLYAPAEPLYSGAQLPGPEPSE